MVCCLTLERPGWWSRAARWLEAAREELVWRLEPEPAVVIPMSADRAREELNRRAEELLDRHGNAILRYAYSAPGAAGLHPPVLLRGLSLPGRGPDAGPEGVHHPV